MSLVTTIRASAHETGLPDKSVHAIITSPPYFGLRAYSGEQDVEWPTVTYRLNEWTEPVTVQGCEPGCEPGCEHEWADGTAVATGRNDSGEQCPNFHGQANGYAGSRKSTQGRYCLHCRGWRGPLGLEPSLVAYVGHLILVLREMRRVLRDDGVVWWNLGDAMSAGGGIQVVQTKNASHGLDGMRMKTPGIPPKNLLMIPAMFALAARADGWYLRSDIIWHKPNPMPESVTDRVTRSHEYIFLLAKQQRYYFDQEAVREKAITEGDARYLRTDNTQTSPNGRNSNNSRMQTGNPTSGRNIRSVWTIATAPYGAAHYAVFPPKLVEPMVLASTSARGVCPQCGKQWVRVVERVKHPERDMEAQRATYAASPGRVDGHVPGPSGMVDATTTLGWQPACICDAGEPVPAVVLDPFAGSGTTGRVAAQHGRRAILIDISGEYLDEHVPDRTTVQMQLEVTS